MIDLLPCVRTNVHKFSVATHLMHRTSTIVYACVDDNDNDEGQRPWKNDGIICMYLYGPFRILRVQLDFIKNSQQYNSAIFSSPHFAICRARCQLTINNIEFLQPIWKCNKLASIADYLTQIMELKIQQI